MERKSRNKRDQNTKNQRTKIWNEQNIYKRTRESFNLGRELIFRDFGKLLIKETKECLMAKCVLNHTRISHTGKTKLLEIS